MWSLVTQVNPSSWFRGSAFKTERWGRDCIRLPIPGFSAPLSPSHGYLEVNGEKVTLGEVSDYSNKQSFEFYINNNAELISGEYTLVEYFWPIVRYFFACRLILRGVASKNNLHEIPGIYSHLLFSHEAAWT